MSEAGRHRSAARVRAALARRLHGPYPGLERIEQRLEELGERVEALEPLAVETSALRGQVEELAALRVGVEGLGAAARGLAARIDALESRLATLSEARRRGDEDLRHTVRALAAKEVENRRALEAVRAEAEYGRAWTDAAPLISVTVATLGRPELISRSLPSILAQSYGALEVIVAADGAPAETGPAVAALGDPRVRYLDLGPGQSWTDDPVKLWLVGGTRARNAAAGVARGRWIVEFDDDDAMRPECLGALLGLARHAGAEAVYGQVRQHAGGVQKDFCAFPPRLGGFSWAGGMYHAGLRFFGRELLAADLGLPGDWWLAERMLRAGVRFAMREEVLCDAYASDMGRDALERGRIPWSADESGRSWG